MTFTFVHTADWQIGKTFGRFPEDVAVRLRDARLEAIDRIAAEAARAGARHVLVAGDVIDSEHLSEAVLRQPLGRMAVYPDLVWHLLPGNHDPARPGGVWERMARLGPPSNVVLHLTAAAHEIEAGVTLLPAPLAAREMSTDPTLWMDAAASRPGTLRIGLAHGSVKGFGSLGEAAVPIDAGRRRSAGLDYLALGDWHGLKQVTPGVWYSGTPEPDSFSDNGPGHVLVVRVAGSGAEPEVIPIVTATYLWRERRAVLARLADIAPIEEEIAALGPQRRKHLLSLVLEGAIGAGDAARLDERLAALAAGLVTVDVDRRRLRIVVGEDDVRRIDDLALAAVAERLRTRAAGPDAGAARVAARAMRLMLALGATEPERTE